jgi:hypothetical protein
VKHQLPAKGLKVAQFAARDLADEYLDQDREQLIPETWQWVQSARSLRQEAALRNNDTRKSEERLR